MQKIATAIFMVLMAMALGALLFTVAYVATDWYRTGSHVLFDQLNANPLPVVRQAWADTMARNFGRMQYAVAAGAIGFLFPLVSLFLMRPRKRNDSRFMTMSDISKTGLVKVGGVFIGRAGGRLAEILSPSRDQRSGNIRLTQRKLIGGKKLWIDGDDVGGFVIGPPRSGKGTSLIIPNALTWRHSLVVLDLRGETYAATAGYRSTMSRVVRFAPAEPDGNTACYNPMDFISLDSAQRDIDLRNIAAALFPRPPSNADPYWVNDARLLFTGIASFIMESPAIPNEKKTFSTILEIMNGAEQPLLELIGSLRVERRRECSHFTLQTLLPYFEMSERQFSGIYAGVRTGMAPFLNERLMRATSRSTFDIRNLKRERLSLYLDVRREQITSLGPLFNVLITQMMNFMSETMPRPDEHPVLVLLDEFQNLGKLENVTEMASVLGGNGVSMWFFVQSLKAVDEIYRQEGRKTLINAARVQIFFGAQDADDLRYVSEQLGETSDVQKDVTRTKATLFDTYYTRSEHRKEVRRPLMRPDEIRTLDKNKVIILPRGELPILGNRNFYFADGQLAKRAFMPLPASTDASRTKRPALDTSAAVPSLAFRTIVPTAPAYRSGLLQTRLRRGATFATKAGRIAPQPTRHVIGRERLQAADAAAVPAYAAIDFTALAAKAVTTRIAPDKEAAVAAILNKVRSLRANASDTEAFDRNLSIVEDALPGLVD